MSDHGEQLGGHCILGKVGYFDESFHIPLVVRDPDGSANNTRGTVVDAFTESIDVRPTILEWLGLKTLREVDGRSPLLFVHEGATSAGWRRHVHDEYDYRNSFMNDARPEEVLGVGIAASEGVLEVNWAGKPADFPPYFNVMASPLRSAFAMSPICRPDSSSTAPFWLVRMIARAPRPTASPAPAAP
jgi:hypothetical protein